MSGTLDVLEQFWSQRASHSTGCMGLLERFAAQYARKKTSEGQKSLFDDEVFEGGQWITIGGAAKGGKQHAGGTPVMVKDGQILKGPSELKGKHLDELSDGRGKKAGGSGVSGEKPVDRDAGSPHEGESSGADGGPGGRVRGVADDSDGGRDQDDADASGSGGESVRGAASGDGGHVPRARRKRREPRDWSTGNWRYTDDEFVGGGKKTKFKRNIDAIRVLRDMEDEGRDTATDEEREILSRFTGWGQFPQVFDETNYQWRNEREALKELLGDDYADAKKVGSSTESRGYRAAREATTNSHFTDPKVVRAHWRIAKKLGFRGGRFLEPSIGSGYYVGLMPPELAPKTSVTGVELDKTTAQVASKLYPASTIHNRGFEEFKAPDNFYDLVASNVPFGDYHLHEQRYNKLRPVIHDHFFLKSLDKAKPGGLVMHVTSAGTLDKKNDRVRRELAQNADLIAAVRMPGGTHKDAADTEVVTDLLIFRKRDEHGAAPEETPDEVQIPEPGFTGVLTDSLGRVYHFVDGKRVPADYWTGTTTVPDPKGYEDIRLSQYFADNPQNVLGTINRSGSMYGAGQVNVEAPEDFDISEALDGFADRLPDMEPKPSPSDSDAFSADAQPAPQDLKVGNYVVRDGDVWQNTSEGMIKRDLPEATANRIIAADGVRGAARDVFRLDRAGENSDAARQQLNDAYDAFVSEHGPLHDSVNIKALHGDPDLPMLLSLEEWDRQTKTATKTDVFERPVVNPDSAPESADTVSEAVGISLNVKGGVDVDYLASLTWRDTEDIEDELRESGLAFEEPGSGWVSAAEYLSGNVREKLEVAKAAAATDDRYQQNVKALERNQPEDIDYLDISAKLGVPWVPSSDMAEFAAHLTGARSSEFAIRFTPETGQWSADYSRMASHSASDRAGAQLWSAEGVPFITILDSALNNKDITVRKPGDDGKPEIDKEATEAVRDKAQEIRDEFSEWLWEDESRRDRLHRFYNDNFNDTVPAKFDGSHLTFPGMSSSWKMRQPQADAVWQIISRGKGVLAHEVGLGKTATMVASAMELKRLGLANKPVMVGKKANLEQLTEEAQQLYPGARILSTAGNFTADKRKETLSRLATGDYDMVIMSHEHLESLPMSPEVERRFIQDQLDELGAVLAMEKRDDDSKGKRTVKQLEKRKKNLEAQLKKAAEHAKDDAITFEDTGIDFMIIDEAHRYKSLPIYTQLSQVKGVPNSSSLRAGGMLMKTQYLQSRNNGRGVVFATGTPISNTIAEMYVMQRFIQPDELKKRGIEQFDAWGATFSQQESKLEPDPLRNDYKEHSRLAKFVNVPELLQLTRQDMDVIRVGDVKGSDGKPLIPRPSRHDHGVTTPETESVRDMMEDIQQRAKAISGKGWKSTKGEDNTISLMTLGRAASVDPRLWSADAQDHPDSKVNTAVRNVLERYHDSQHAGETQLIFSDVGVNPSPKTGFHLYKDLIDKLVAGGIPREEIADFGSLDGKRKEDAAAKLKAGKIRIGIGSTERLGTGTNVQTHIGAIHHLDIPYVPTALEQRNGRAHRFGNRNSDVDIYNYSTESSFDEMSWGIVARKMGFISQAMKNPRGAAREVYEEDQESLSPEQLMAAASGDTRVVERINLADQVKRLRRSKSRHNRNQQMADSRIAKSRQEADETDAKSRKIMDDYELAQSHGKSPIVIGSTAFEDRNDAQEQLDAIGANIDRSQEAVDRRNKWFTKGDKAGEFRGLSLVRAGASWWLEGPTGERYRTSGTVRSIEQTANNLKSRAEKLAVEAQEMRDSATYAESQKGKAFARQRDLEDAERRLKELEEQMRSGTRGRGDSTSNYSRRVANQVVQYLKTAHPERYGRWITIGSEKSNPPGEKGGTPVYVGEGGQIQKGPDSLEGKDLDSLGSDGPRTVADTRKMFPKGSTVTTPNGRTATVSGLHFASGAGDVSVSYEDGGSDTFSAEDLHRSQNQVTDADRAKPDWMLKREQSKPRWFNPKKNQGRLFDPYADAEPENAPPPAVQQLPGAPEPLQRLSAGKHSRYVGATLMDVSDLHADPNRFQYKVSGIDPKTGTTAELREVDQYNPMFGGQLLVWHDPDDGQTYVVNGHHRYELASRSPKNEQWGGEMGVYYIDAPDAQQARALGALANIAEGRGTATDAAKFLRDSGSSVDDLKRSGVSLKGRVAADASHLSNLSDTAFHRLTTGFLSEQRALAISSNLTDHDKQNRLLQMIDNREQTGARKLTDSTVAEMARMLDVVPKKEGGGGLFGDDFADDLLAERGELVASVRRSLAGEARTFKDASSERRGSALESTGTNVIDVEGNAQRARESAVLNEDFNQRINWRGDPLAELFNEYAQQLADNPRSGKSIKRELLERARQILSEPGDPGSTAVSAAPGGAAVSGGGYPTGRPTAADRQHFSRRMSHDVVRYLRAAGRMS